MNVLPTGHYKLTVDHDETSKMLVEIWGVVCKVVWLSVWWMSPRAWLTEIFHEERDQVETEPESRTPGTWENSGLDSEIRRRVNLEFRESLPGKRETGLREWGQRAGNAWDKWVGEPVCFSAPVEPRTNNVPVRHPQEGQLVSPIRGSGVYSEHGPFPTQTGGQSPSVWYGSRRQQSQIDSRLSLSPGNRTV